MYIISYIEHLQYINIILAAQTRNIFLRGLLKWCFQIIYVYN